MRTHRPSALILALLCAAPAARAQAHADPAWQAQVRAIASSHAGGQHARALELAVQALSLRETGTLHGIIARELIELRRHAEAVEHVEACVRDAPAQPPSANRDVILAYCREQRVALASLVGAITVRVAPAPPGVRIAVGDRTAEAPEATVRVDPVRVAVTVTAPGFAPYHRELEVAAGATVVLPTELAPLAPEAPPPPPAEARVAPPAPPPRPTTASPTPPAPHPTRRHPLGYALIGAGAASLLASAITWGVAEEICRDRPSDASAGCGFLPGEDPSTVRALDAATTATLVAGASLVAIGTALLFTLRAADTGAAPRVSLSAGPGAVGLSGTF
ncbi:MAG: hypothetical protein U0324_15550 [Polyangiales bacterium]